MDIQDYIKQFRKLNRSKNKSIWDERTQNGAPHKPFLLLIIIDYIKNGQITSPIIPLSQDLVDDFRMYWNGIIPDKHNSSIAYPFFYKKSEPFWEIHFNADFPYSNKTWIPSVQGLQNYNASNHLDDDLFTLLKDDTGRDTLRRVLLDEYFDKESQQKINEISNYTELLNDYSKELLGKVAEPFEKYHAKSHEITHSYRWIQNRDKPFSRLIRKAYNYQCAVCQSGILTDDGLSLVEGAHIIPWSKSYNDDLRNGLSLCPSHHWMFDHYLLAVRIDYTVAISKKLKLWGKNVEDTLAKDKEIIALPEDKRYYPAMEALEEHWERFEN
jgi:putative restriction endonuclease